MASDPTAAFLSALAGCRLLAPARVAELTAWAKTQPNLDPQAVAKEVSRRGWLTPYQIKEVFRGRGAELIVGPYQLLDLLGEGAMGRVFKAHHTRLGREVALKLIRKDKLANPLTVRRFLQEVQATAHLSHPNVVLALDADEIDGTHFYAMEYVEGQDLTKLVKQRGPLPVAEACEYIRQAALGLHHAHERGLVHRDVKPSNLLATPGGQVKVLDLGLAMLNVTTAEDAGNRVTLDGYVIGTPDFLAPEQARDPQSVDTRADVYALGCTLFYLLTARPPFDGATPTDKMLKHVMDPPPDVRQFRPDVPPGLSAVLFQMLAKSPADRPRTPLAAALAVQPFGPSGTGVQPRLPAPAPTTAPDPAGSSHLFRLPASEAPARVRERVQRQGGGFLTFVIGLLAVLATAALGFSLYLLLNGPGKPLDPEFTTVAGQRMLFLPPGTFVMGSPDDEPGRTSDEGPTGEVTVAGFYLSATEVTNAQYTALMDRSPAAAVSRARNAGELPVERVTWTEAAEYCKRLTDRDHRRKGWAYRLPTEAEWEYACRAGTTGPFAFGDKLPVGNGAVFTPSPNDPQSEGDPPPPPTMPGRVGQTTANRFGLFDLHGNVSEWCQDHFTRGYPPGPRSNPTGPAEGDLYAIRGGGWPDPAGKCRSAARRGLPADTRDAAVGFRVAYARTER